MECWWRFPVSAVFVPWARLPDMCKQPALRNALHRHIKVNRLINSLRKLCQSAISLYFCPELYVKIQLKGHVSQCEQKSTKFSFSTRQKCRKWRATETQKKVFVDYILLIVLNFQSLYIIKLWLIMFSLCKWKLHSSPSLLTTGRKILFLFVLQQHPLGPPLKPSLPAAHPIQWCFTTPDVAHSVEGFVESVMHVYMNVLCILCTCLCSSGSWLLLKQNISETHTSSWVFSLKWFCWLNASSFWSTEDFSSIFYPAWH